MKNFFIYSCLFLLLVSCGDKRKRIVSKFEQNFFANKTDLAFKILNIKDIRTFYGKDSAVIVKHMIDSLVQLEVEMHKILMRTDSSLIRDFSRLPNKKMKFQNINFNLLIVKTK